MAEYRRFVSYIYAYDRDIKSKNVGFAKTEVRDGECRVSVNIKGAFAASGKELSVYLFHREQEMLLGTWMGSFTVKNGSGDFRVVTSADDIGGSGLPLEEMNGIILRHRGDDARMYASGWDDHVITSENFIPVNHEEEPEAQLALTAEKEELSAAELLPVMEAVEEELARLGVSSGQNEVAEPEAVPQVQPEMPPAAEPEPQRNIPEVQPMQPETSVPEIWPMQPGTGVPETQPMQPGRNMPEMQPVPEVQPAKPGRGVPEIQPEPERKVPEIQPIHPMEEPTVEEPETPVAGEMYTDGDMRTEQKQLGEQPEGAVHSGLWDRLENIFPKVVAFEDEPDIICLKIDLKDLEYLPRENWGLANNSFLLHGYYNFRYLILAKMGEDKCMIGIPGMFHNNERFMAAMFGFDHFKPVKDYKPLTGHFGYWYQWIQM